MSLKKVTVIGSTGTIGSELIDLLSAVGVDTIAIYRSENKKRDLPHIEWRKADYNQVGSLESVLQETDKLFLLTGNRPGFGQAQIDIIEAAEENDVKHVVKLSALGATPRTKAPLALEHWNAEQALEHSEMEWTILRPHAFMQNWIRDLAETVKREGKIYAAVGDGKVPFIDARDIAAVAKEILINPDKHHGKRYVLTSGQAVGYAELADALTQATQQGVEYISLSNEEMRQRMQKQGVSDKMIDSYLALQSYQRAGGPTARVSPDVQEILGREARGVYEFAEDYKAYFM